MGAVTSLLLPAVLVVVLAGCGTINPSVELAPVTPPPDYRGYAPLPTPTFAEARLEPKVPSESLVSVQAGVLVQSSSMPVSRPCRGD